MLPYDRLDRLTNILRQRRSLRRRRVLTRLNCPDRLTKNSNFRDDPYVRDYYMETFSLLHDGSFRCPYMGTVDSKIIREGLTEGVTLDCLGCWGFFHQHCHSCQRVFSIQKQLVILEIKFLLYRTTASYVFDLVIIIRSWRDDT